MHQHHDLSYIHETIKNVNIQSIIINLAGEICNKINWFNSSKANILLK